MTATIKTRETAAQAMRRLALAARDRDLVLVSFELEPGEVTFFVSSASQADALHLVSLDACDCEGHARVGRCTHRALVLSALGLLPQVSAAEDAATMQERQDIRLERAEVVRLHRGQGIELGARLDAADGEYPTAGEFRALVKMAARRGVRIEGTRERPVAIDPMPSGGTFALTLLSCSCRSFANVGACCHHAAYIDRVADEAERIALAA